MNLKAARPRPEGLIGEVVIKGENNQPIGTVGLVTIIQPGSPGRTLIRYINLKRGAASHEVHRAIINHLKAMLSKHATNPNDHRISFLDEPESIHIREHFTGIPLEHFQSSNPRLVKREPLGWCIKLGDYKKAVERK